MRKSHDASRALCLTLIARIYWIKTEQVWITKRFSNQLFAPCTLVLFLALPEDTEYSFSNRSHATRRATELGGGSPNIYTTPTRAEYG